MTRIIADIKNNTVRTEPLSEQEKERLAFADAINASKREGQVLRQELLKLDETLPRILEDLIEASGLLASLPEISRKIFERKASLRERLRAILRR
jgi:small-conductance mechanosensitive channel